MHRRQYLAIASLSLVSGCSALGEIDGEQSTPTPGQLNSCSGDWGWQYQRDAAHRGTVTSLGDLSAKPGMEVLVESDTEEQFGFNEPAASVNDLVVAAADRSVRCYNTESGELRWEQSLAETVAAGPVVGCDGTYIQTTRGTHCFENETGERRWHAEHGNLTWTPVAVYDGYLFTIAPRGVRQFDPESGDSRLVYEYTSPTGLASMAVHDGSLYATRSADTQDGSVGTLLRIDLDTGEIIWTQEGYRCRAPPTIVDGTMYQVTKEGVAVAVATNDGSVMWQTSVGGPQTYESPVVGLDGDRVYLATGQSGSIVALNATTGDQEWETSIGAFAGTPPIVGSETIIGGGRGVHGLVPATGAKRWTIETGQIDTPFTKAGNTLLTTSGDSIVQLMW